MVRKHGATPKIRKNGLVSKYIKMQVGCGGKNWFRTTIKVVGNESHVQVTHLNHSSEVK